MNTKELLKSSRLCLVKLRARGQELWMVPTSFFRKDSLEWSVGVVGE